MNILKLNSLIRAKVHQWTVENLTQFPSEFDVLSANNVFLRILVTNKIFLDTSINTEFNWMLASDFFVLFSLFINEFEVISKKLELTYETGGDAELEFTGDGIFESFLEIDLFLKNEFDEIAIEKKLVRVMEIEVDTVKGKHVVDLLIVHRLKYFISIYQCYNQSLKRLYFSCLLGLATFHSKKIEIYISECYDQSFLTFLPGLLISDSIPNIDYLCISNFTGSVLLPLSCPCALNV